MTRLLHKYGPGPSFVSPHAGHSKATVGSEDAAALGASCSNRTVILTLSGCFSPAASDPLLPTWMSLILSSSCWVFCDVTARCVRMSNRHLLLISVFGSRKHIPCTSFNSSSFPLSLALSQRFCLCIHPCFSRQGSLNDRSDSLSAFVIMWLCRSSMRCERRTPWTTSSVSVSFSVRSQNVESSRLRRPGALSTTILGSGGSRSFFVSCDLLRQLQFWSHHLPRSATQTFPVRRFPSITECLSCPTFASHSTVLGNAQNCSCSVISNFTKPNFLSKLRHWLSPSSTSSPQFTCFSIFADSHLVHDLRCKTRKPTE